jgi:hypothetical protein
MFIAVCYGATVPLCWSLLQSETALCAVCWNKEQRLFKKHPGRGEIFCKRPDWLWESRCALRLQYVDLVQVCIDARGHHFQHTL